MTLFEKQQTIEAIKTIVKARWFLTLALFIQGLIFKIFFPQVPLASTWQLSLILILAFLYNFSYWFYLHRPIEKISDSGLKFVKGLQLILDQLAISAILYFSGTTDKMTLVLYFVVLMIGSSLYTKKGIILSMLSCSFLYSSLVVLEYYGLFPSVSAGAVNFISAKGNVDRVSHALVGFNAYIIAAAFFTWYLGSLFKGREKRLVVQKNELLDKTAVLTHQTQELTQAKDQIQGALTRSDISRKAATQARDEMEKANLELKQKIDELEKFYKVTVGREVRMAELKSQIKELKETIKKLEREISKK